MSDQRTNDLSDETWGRLQMAYRARKHMLVMLAQWTEELRELETRRYGHPLARRPDVEGFRDLDKPPE